MYVWLTPRHLQDYTCLCGVNWKSKVHRESMSLELFVPCAGDVPTCVSGQVCIQKLFGPKDLHKWNVWHFLFLFWIFRIFLHSCACKTRYILYYKHRNTSLEADSVRDIYTVICTFAICNIWNMTKNCIRIESTAWKSYIFFI